jgi:hypothetical protein
MRKYIIVLLLLTGTTAFGQHKINLVLKKQLDSVMVLDQKYRDTLSMFMNPAQSDSLAKKLSLKTWQAMNRYTALQGRLDSLNVIFIEDVFKKYGYPGKTLVDTPANESAWYIIQHSQKINQYIPMMKKAAESGELPFHLYAMMLDRELMYAGKEQVYGSQVSCRDLKNGKHECFVWPIKDAATVNERRKKAGFTQTVEENAQRLGVAYRVVKIDEVK